MKKSIRVLALLLTLAMLAGMIPAFVVSAEDAGQKTLTLEKDTFNEGEDIVVNAVGEGKDWVGLYLADDVFKAEEGQTAVASIYWYYVAEHSTMKIQDAEKNSQRANLFSLPAGEYKLVLFENDGYTVLDEKRITIVKSDEFQDLDEGFELAGGQGSPFAAHGAGQSFAVRVGLANGRRLAAFKSFAMATYSAPCQQITYTVYVWDTDYATTLKSAPVYTYVEKDHADNAPVNVAIPKELNLTGDVLIVTTCDQADAGITYWMASEQKYENATFFDNGVEGAPFCCSIVTAKALPETETMDPTFVLDFGIYTEDANALFGFQNVNEAEYTNLLNSGYITFKATGGDPYTWIGGEKVMGSLLGKISTTKLDYMVIKYRTAAAGASMEFFVQRADGVNPGQDGSYCSAPLNGDGYWHTVIADASNVWGNTDTMLTIFRIDPLAGDVNGKEIDIASITFFSNQKAAEAYAAAQAKTETFKGELTYKDPAVLTYNGVAYTSEKLLVLTDAGEGKYTDADGNEYTIKGGRLLDAEGVDTQMTVPAVTDDGRIVAVKHLIPLTYQDPLDGAVEVDGKKYIYEQKVAVTEVYVPVDPEDNSVSSERHAAVAAIAGMSPDSFYINNNMVKDGSAHAYIADTLQGKIRDTKKEYSSISFRGWAYTTTAAEPAIAAYGYALNDGDIVWNAAWINAGEPGLPGGNPTRYKIDVDVSSLADGWYSVYLFVKDTSDNVYRLNVWGDFKFIKGGEMKLDHYTDGTNTYGLDSLIYTEGEQKYVLLGATDVTDGLAGGYDYDAVLENYELDISTKGETQNRNNELTGTDPLVVWGAAGYDNAEGKEMIAMYGDHDYALFKDLDFSKYQRLEIIIGTDNGVKDNIAVGFVSDKANIYGQDINNMNLTSNIAYGIAAPAAEGQPNLSGRGSGAGWNATERKIVIDLENVDYKGDAYLSVSTTGGNITVIAKINFIAYEKGTVKGKYVYDYELNYVDFPAIPVNPAKVKPVYILDGEGLNVGSDAMRTEASVYDYDKGCIRYTAAENDPNAGSAQIPAGTVVAPYMVVKYRTEVGCVGEVFVGTGAGASGGSHVSFPNYVADGQWHYFVVDLRESGDYNASTNVINHFRNDFAQGAGEWVEIEYYAFFDSFEMADYYGAHDLHELPSPIKTYKATFVDEDGNVIKVVEFKTGATKLTGIPKPPAKEGYTAAWEKYELKDEDITIHVVYTAKETPSETETESTTEPTQTDTETEPAATETDAPDSNTEAPKTDTESESATAVATTGASESKGCKSFVAVSGAIVLLAVAGAAVVLKKKED